MRLHAKLVTFVVLMISTGSMLNSQALWRANTKRNSLFTGGPVPRTASVVPNQGSPSWWQIETTNEPMDYKLYWAPNPAPHGGYCEGPSYNCEILGTTGDNALTPYGTLRVRPPASYYFITSPPPLGKETQYGGCGPYNGSYTDPPTSMFNVSKGYTGAKGLVMQGYLGGGDGAYSSPWGAYSLAVAYVASNPCSANNQEYGFFADTTKSTTGDIYGQTWVFYYSLYTNTPQQQTSAPQDSAVISKITFCPTCGGMAYFSMYIIPTSSSSTVTWSDSGFDFRIQVLDSNYALTNCSINGSSSLMPCTVDIPINRVRKNDGLLTVGDLWPVTPQGAMPGTSYLVAGTQTSSWQGINPVYTCPTCANGMWINGLWLGF